MCSHFFFLDLQQRSQFCFVVIESYRRIEYQYSVCLCTVEDSLLVIVLHVRRHHYCTFYLDTAFFCAAVFIQLSQQTFQHVVFLILFYLVVFGSALSIHLHLLVYHCVCYFDIVVIYSVSSRQFYIEFRSQSDIEREFEVFVCLKVYVIFFRQRSTQHVHFVFADILTHLFLHQLINFFDQHRNAVLLLDQSHRNHSFTESRHIYSLTKSLQ